MGIVLFHADELEGLNMEDITGYLYSFTSLLVSETIENWCQPQTTLDINRYEGVAPHISTLRKKIDLFFSEHADGIIWIEWLSDMPYASFGSTMKIFVEVFEKTFEHSSLKAKFPNINPEAVLTTLCESIMMELDNLADEKEGKGEMTKNHLAKKEFLGELSHNEGYRMGRSHYLGKCIGGFREMWARIMGR